MNSKHKVSTCLIHTLVDAKNKESPKVHGERKDDMPNFDININ